MRASKVPPSRRERQWWILSVSAICVAIIQYCTPLRVSNHTSIHENSVMIVLGIRESPENLRLRVVAAAKEATTHVILSGGVSGDAGESEAKAMRDLWPITAAANTITFYLEEDSQSTCQNAFYSIPILLTIAKVKNLSTSIVDRVLVVTNDFHAPRTKLLFEQVFATKELSHIQIDILAAPTVLDERTSLVENEFNWLQATRLKLLLENMTDHPFQLPSEKRIQQARSELQNHEPVQ